MKLEKESVIIARSMRNLRINNFTNRKMRGNDYMSASDKKKLRKELESAALTEKQLAQQKEDKQLKNYTLTFVIVMALVVAIAVTSMGFSWWVNSGIPAQNTVALTIGSTTMSNTDLNYYFVDTINNFYSEVYDEYSSYAAMYVSLLYGLDMTQPLDSQIYNESTGDTWADYFLDSAIASAQSTYVLYNAAMSSGDFELPADIETELNNAMAYTTAYAGYYGYSTTDAYLKAMYGNGASEESYYNYYRINAIAEAYYSAYAETLEYTDEEIETFNQENYNNFSTFYYDYFYVPVSKYLPETEEGVELTEEQYADAIAAAQEAANGLTAATDLESFNALISELSFAVETTDAEAINGTTYSSIATLYAEWVGDTQRVPGEMGVFEYESTTDEDETVDGYYVVLFESRNDYDTPMRSVRHMLVKFEGGTTEDGETVYSDEEKAAAKTAAEKTYNEWLSGKATEDTFAAMVSSETSDDTGSSSNGGLYTNIYEGQMVENFNNWVFDPARQPGDHEIIETEIGYHIMYFVEVQEDTYREYLIEYSLRSNDTQEWYEKLLETVEVVEGDTSYINKSLVITTSTSTTY